jgi:phytanoyl-CoA hydroxylase
MSVQRLQFDDAAVQQSYNSSGFALFPTQALLDPELTALCRQRLQAVARGEYDTGEPPFVPCKAGASPTSTIHVVNAHRADHAIRRLATNPLVGELIARVTGWSSVKLAQDQVWVKPPGCGPLSFHRDSPYLDFDPSDVATLWITLDDISTDATAHEMGALQYCPGSHRWVRRNGIAKHFFLDDYTSLLRSAAQSEGLNPDEAVRSVVTVKAPAGGCSLHNGLTWHGSGNNLSLSAGRHGIGIHFIPGHAQFRQGYIGKLWAPYVTAGSREMPESVFPVVWPLKSVKSLLPVTTEFAVESSNDAKAAAKANQEE